MHCDAGRGKAASGGDRLALDESKRLASRTADALLQGSKSRMLGAAGKGPIAATPAQCFRGGSAEHGRNPIGQAA